MTDGAWVERAILPPTPAGFPYSLLFASAVGAGLAHLGAVAMPFQIGAIMDGLDVSPAAAGVFGFLQLGALALSMMVSAPVIDRVPAGGLAVGGALLAALANLAMFLFATSLIQLCILAVFAGAGYGLVFAATIARVSMSAQADRVYAISSGGSVLIVVALMSLFPLISKHFGLFGPFLGIGMLVMLTAPLLVGFGWKTRSALAPAAPLIRSRGAVAIYLMWTCFSLGSSVAWSFAERMGHAIAMDSATVGTILSISTFVGISGTLLAATGAGRWPRLVSAAVGLGGTGIGLLLFSTAGSALTFALGVLCFWISSMFFYCVMLGTAAALDPSGRIGTSGGGFDRLGFAFGAPLGGIILDHSSFAMLGLVAFAICILPGFYSLPVLRAELAS